MYYVYMLRCEDNSIYTGITTDVTRRMEEHKSRNEKCAKYTLRHHAKQMESIWQTEDRKHASQLEYHIKTLNKEQKERLIKDKKALEEVLGNKIEVEQYKKIVS